MRTLPYPYPQPRSALLHLIDGEQHLDCIMASQDPKMEQMEDTSEVRQQAAVEARPRLCEKSKGYNRGGELWSGFADSLSRAVIRLMRITIILFVNRRGFAKHADDGSIVQNFVIWNKERCTEMRYWVLNNIFQRFTSSREVIHFRFLIRPKKSNNTCRKEHYFMTPAPVHTYSKPHHPIDGQQKKSLSIAHTTRNSMFQIVKVVGFESIAWIGAAGCISDHRERQSSRHDLL